MIMKGLRLVVAAFGILCGLTGIIAGIFEMLQGNTPTTGLEISTIGSTYLMVDDFTYYAITVIPNFFITGILAIIVSTLVIIWSIQFVHRKNGVAILFVLCLSQMLFGGAWVIDIALITCILAIGINRPLSWWSSYFSPTIQRKLVRLFPLSIASYTLISGAMLILTVIGVNNQVLIDMLSPLASLMFIPILLMVLGGLSVEMQRQVLIH
jgi:hypothetical protein